MRTPSSRKALRKALALAALAVLVTCRSAERGPPPPAGIVLLLGDDHGRDDVGVLGHPSVRTPALDALAREGLTFTGVRAVTAICLPSRAALLTGLHPESNGVFGFYDLREGVVPLTVRLADAGFFCGIVGKHHIYPFEAYRFHYAPDMTAEQGRDVERVVADVRGFFDARAVRAPGAPYFLLVAFFDAHRPFPRAGGTGMEAPVPHPTDPARVALPPYLPDLPKVREEVSGYLDAVQRLDRTVAGVLSELDRRGADDALVLYTSDHGAPFPFAKSTVYEAGLAVPFLARWPGHVPAGRTTDALVSLVDVAPTLLELARVAAPELEGRSFAPLLLGRADAHRTHLFATQTDHLRPPSRPMRSVRTERYHYIVNFDGKAPLTIESVTTEAWDAMVEAAGGDPQLAQRVQHFLERPPEELYDLARDPHELDDRGRDPAFAAVRAELRALMLDDMRAIDDPFLFIASGATDADRDRTRDAYERWRDR